MALALEKSEKNTLYCVCQAFCPVCGTDLYYRDSECICKNKDCSWLCMNCHEAP